jgi:hypothetical protein
MTSSDYQLRPRPKREQRLVAWQPGRRTALIALVTGIVAGAATGAQLATQPESPYSAEVVVEADRAASSADRLESEGRAAVRLARLEEVLGLPQVATAVKETTSAPGDLRDRVTVTRSPVSGLLRISARGGSPAQAAELANAFLAQALAFIRGLDALDGDRVVLGDFEADLEGWGGPSLFAVPPNSLRVVRGDAKFNSSALHVTCLPRAGCGPSIHFFYPFQADRVYEATAWLRGATRRSSVTMVFGVNSGDYVALPPTRLRRAWTRYSLQWVPKQNYRNGELTVQTANLRAAEFYIDGVSLAWGRAITRAGSRRAAERAEAQAFAQGPYVAAWPAVPTGELERRTALWTLAGAAFGFIAAASVVGIGWTAARRRQE